MNYDLDDPSLDLQIYVNFTKARFRFIKGRQASFYYILIHYYCFHLQKCFTRLTALFEY